MKRMLLCWPLPKPHKEHRPWYQQPWTQIQAPPLFEIWASLVTSGRFGVPVDPIVLGHVARMALLHSWVYWAGRSVRRPLAAAPGLRPAVVCGRRLRCTPHSFVSPPTLVMFQQTEIPTVLLFLTVSHFVSILLSSFCYSGFQKIVQLPKLVE